MTLDVRTPNQANKARIGTAELNYLPRAAAEECWRSETNNTLVNTKPYTAEAEWCP